MEQIKQVSNMYPPQYGGIGYGGYNNPTDTKIIQIARGDEFGMISCNNIDLDQLQSYIEQKFKVKRGLYQVSFSSASSYNYNYLPINGYSKPKVMNIESDEELICAITSCPSLVLNLNIDTNGQRNYSMHVKAKSKL